MDNDIRPLEVYIVAININNARNEKDYTTKEEVENNQQSKEDFAIVELLHIGE